MPLDEYAKKRDFEKTAEPDPFERHEGSGPLRFVIQKHAARRLHYDLRLEWDGALKSWAVPKGPSAKYGEKRMAVHVEDHPLDYASFEGSIPKGEYGGGEVIVWDEGTYSPDEDGNLYFDDRAKAEEEMRKGYEKGKLSFTLRGHKLKGSYALVRMKSGKDWLLLKHQDEHVTDGADDVLQDERSVLSGRTVEDVREGRAGKAYIEEDDPVSKVKGARETPLPVKPKPMAAEAAEKPFSKPDWLYEIKFDGIRVIAVLDHGKVTLWSRGDRDVTKQFPSVAASLAKLDLDTAILDGEVVAFDAQKRPSFEVLLGRFNLQNEHDIRRAEGTTPVTYCVFDVLYKNGYDIRQATLDERRKVLDSIPLPPPRLQKVEAFYEDGEALYQGAINLGLEGIIAKKRNSRYEAGVRSNCWLKIKGQQTEDFFIAGYTKGSGSRESSLGSLVLARYEDGKPVYAGQAGSGLTEASLKQVLDAVAPYERKTSPFEGKIEMKGKIACWIEPVVGVEVKYGSLTTTGILRAPVFLRLRPDISPPRPNEGDEAPGEGSPAQSITSVVKEPMAVQKMQVSEDPQDLLEQIDALKKQEGILEIGEYRLKVTNPEKVLWPERGRHREVRKKDLFRYWAQIWPYVAPHMKDRPLTLNRFPNGIEGGNFYQKHQEHKLPDFVETVDIWSEHNKAAGDYILVNNLPTVLWLAQIADLEMHTWYSRVDPHPDAKDKGKDFWSNEEAIDASVLNYPDFMVVDLDPYIYSGKEAKGAEPEFNEPAFEKCVEIAFATKELLDQLGLAPFIKTSGKTGLHLYVPIKRNLDYDQTRAICQTIGVFLLRQRPQDVTMEWNTQKRAGKIFFDHNQNTRGKTLATIYSPRPVLGAPCSIPVTWEELAKVHPWDWNVWTVPDRLAETGDLWHDILDSKVDLSPMLNKG